MNILFLYAEEEILNLYQLMALTIFHASIQYTLAVERK
jgi:hypothetical protein